MEWNRIEKTQELEQYLQQSYEKPVLFFKHSIRCSISATVLNRLERNWKPDAGVTPVYLDLINFRPVSNHLAEVLAVQHESPQAILVHRGEVIRHWSHFEIDWRAISESTPKN
jgi:bacillithiol system protein YtxJ